MREAGNLEVLHGNDIGRGSGGAFTSSQYREELRVVVSNNDADAQSTEDEESTKSEVDCLEGVLDVDTWALSFARDHGDVLGADDTEGCSPERAEEAFKATKRAVVVGIHWARVAPVAETVRVLLGVSTNHGDESEEVKDQDEQNLATREPELSFTVRLDGEDVASAAESQFVWPWPK